MPALQRNDDQPRVVLISVAEFHRLDQPAAHAGATMPQLPKPTVIRGPREDPLGYDTTDVERCAAEMAARVLAGANKAAVDKELRRVRARFGLDGQN